MLGLVIYLFRGCGRELGESLEGGQKGGQEASGGLIQMYELLHTDHTTPARFPKSLKGITLTFLKSLFLKSLLSPDWLREFLALF